MRKIEISVFKFSELSEKAKQNALAEYQNDGEYFWADENRQTLESFADRFPITINKWSYGGRGEGVFFTFNESDEIEELNGVRLRTYLINNYYDILFERKPQGAYTKNEKTGKWSYKRLSRITFVETSCPFTGYCVDEDILDPIRTFVNKPNSTNFKELIDECFDSWVRACNADYEYQFSEEAYSEHCEANEYEFDESGNLI